MPLKNCHCTFSAQRWTSFSSLRFKLCFRYSRLTINRTGRRGLPAGADAAAEFTVEGAGQVFSPITRLAGYAWWASLGASAASIDVHGNRVASTASGCRRTIIWSSRERKKSGVLIIKSPRNQLTPISNSGDPGSKIHAAKRVFMRRAEHLQGRLVS
jgi:hypothetical protein